MRAIPVFLALATASCSASYPTAPDPTLVGVQVFYGQGMSNARVGRWYSFKAYAVYSDGAYEDVTNTATWSADEHVMAYDREGHFRAVGAGRADVTARYQSRAGSLSIPVVRDDQLSYPRLEVLGGDPKRIGNSEPVTLWLLRDGSGAKPVERSASWTSGNPSIVIVTDAHVAAVRAGTTWIAATYEGLSVQYNLSVQPRR